MIDLSAKSQLEQAIIRLAPNVNPYNAHRTLFAHRHPNQTPDFHFRIIEDLHGSSRRVLLLAFRGAGKSTLAEEAITIGACWRRFRNHIIIGESATRACERLAAIKHELDFNPYIRTVFGDLHGPTWNEDKIVLTNGVVIQAFGRGQSLRGTKHDDQRPDRCLIDDIEDEESVSSPIRGIRLMRGLCAPWSLLWLQTPVFIFLLIFLIPIALLCGLKKVVDGTYIDTPGSTLRTKVIGVRCGLIVLALLTSTDPVKNTNEPGC